MKFKWFVLTAIALSVLMLALVDTSVNIPWRQWADMVMQYDLVSIIGGM